MKLSGGFASLFQAIPSILECLGCATQHFPGVYFTMVVGILVEGGCVDDVEQEQVVVRWAAV